MIRHTPRQNNLCRNARMDTTDGWSPSANFAREIGTAQERTATILTAQADQANNASAIVQAGIHATPANPGDVFSVYGEATRLDIGAPTVVRLMLLAYNAAGQFIVSFGVTSVVTTGSVWNGAVLSGRVAPAETVDVRIGFYPDLVATQTWLAGGRCAFSRVRLVRGDYPALGYADDNTPLWSLQEDGTTRQREHAVVMR